MVGALASSDKSPCEKSTSILQSTGIQVNRHCAGTIAQPRRTHLSTTGDSACRSLYNEHVLNPRAANEVLPLAVGPELSENSRPGFESKNCARHLGQEICNSTTALGIEPGLMVKCIGSRIQTWNRYAYVGNNPLSYVDPYQSVVEPADFLQDVRQCRVRDLIKCLASAAPMRLRQNRW